MKFQVKNRWSGETQYECELTAEVAGLSYGLQLGWAIKKAVEEGANLSGSNLSGSDLSGSDLSGSDLSYSDLRGSDLRGSDLSGSDLSGSDLSYSDLSGSNLSGSNLSGSDLSGSDLSGSDLSYSDLSGSNLSGSDLSGSDLTPIRDDVWAVLSSAPEEVQALRDAIAEGRVNGSTYAGDCACLVGTLAHARGTDEYGIPGLSPTPSRPAERFFMCINRGDTPATNQASALALEWVDQWLANMRAAFATKVAGAA